MLNPIQIMQMLQTVRNSQNPQEAIFNMFGNTPQVNEVMNLARYNDPQILLRQVCQQRGIDFNQLMQMVKSMGLN